VFERKKGGRFESRRKKLKKRRKRHEKKRGGGTPDQIKGEMEREEARARVEEKYQP